MSNKKMYLIIALIIGVVAAAAFVGGRLLNASQQTGLPGLLPSGDGSVSGITSLAINMSPAPELPTTQPEVTGTFAKRQDNSIFIQSFSMLDGVSGAAGVVIASGSADGPSTSFGPGPAASSGPTTEVVITSDTKLWRDATDPGIPSAETTNIQQKVEPGSLDDLKTQTMVMVWGRKSCDRIIADVVSYSNPIMIQK